MAEIKEFQPSTIERPKPEKSADIVFNEELEKRRRGIALKREEKEATKSPSQIKGEMRQRFIEKIKEVGKQFEKIKEEDK